MVINIPTNGALMTSDEFEALRLELAVDGTPREKAMYRQMQVMVYGAEAHRLVLENERRCRMIAETQARELRLKIDRARTLLKVPLSKLKVADLKKLVIDALDELGMEEIEK